MEYTTFVLSGTAGLSHQTSNLNCILKYSYLNRLKLVLPIWNLDPKHNNNKLIRTNLSEYYDFDNLLVNDLPYKVFEKAPDNSKLTTIPIKQAKYNLVRKDPKFLDASESAIKISIPYHKDIIQLGEKIAMTLGEYTCVHVRRTDRLTNNQIKMDTCPINIIKKIKEFNLKNVYIMSDEKDPQFYKDLKTCDQSLTIRFMTDFELLQKLKQKDNYYLFCVENVICLNAKIRISTFNTPGIYYNSYLSKITGWQ